MLIFSKKFCTLCDNLLATLPPPSLRFGLNSVQQYYEKILKYPKSKFKFDVVSEETVLKLLQDLDENKAVDLDNHYDLFNCLGSYINIMQFQMTSRKKSR